MKRIYRTRAFEYATLRNLTPEEMAARSGLSIHTIYAIKEGKRGCGPTAIAGLQRVFPEMRFEALFYLEEAPGGEPARNGNGSEAA